MRRSLEVGRFKPFGALGKAFVTRHTTATVFADFEHDHKEDLGERPVWTLSDPMTLPAEAFRKVYA